MLHDCPGDTGARERFLREARAAAQVVHDNVVTIYEADEHEGMPYIAMQFLEGCSLEDYLRKKGRPTVAQVLKVGRETAAGLAAAHKIGLIHRDIKPANLWLEAPGGRIKVLDFGLARPVNGDNEVTKSGEILGTPAYMSPEQARGLKLDHRTDLYSLGAVLYRLCTGSPPFQGTNTMAMLMALGTEDPAPVRDISPEVPEPLAELIHQLLAKDPMARPRSAEEVVKRIRAIAEGGRGPARPDRLPLRSDVAPSRRSEQAAPRKATDQSSQETMPEEDTAEQPRSPARRALPPRRRISLRVAVGLVSVLAGTVLAAVIVIKTKDGKETRIEVPDDASVTIERPGVGSIEVKPPAALPKPPAVLPQPPTERAAAEAILALGGAVRLNVNGEDREYDNPANLPQGDLTLTGVSLYGKKRVTDADLANLRDCKRLTVLILNKTSITDAGLAHLKGCNLLREIGLDDTMVSDVGLANIDGARDLHLLSLGFTKVSNAGLARFPSLTKLIHLNLTSTLVTDPGLARLSECRNLQFLSLANTRVTDAGLANLSNCKQLNYLDLTSTTVSDEGLAAFKDCKMFRFIHLPGTRVTDAGLAYFRDCKALKWLTLRQTKVTDAGMENFKDCKNLENLLLENTAITDAALKYFQDTKSLKSIGLTGTKVTREAVEEFANRLPRCTIVYDQGKLAPR